MTKNFLKAVLSQIKTGYFKNPITSETIAERLKLPGHRPEKKVILAVNKLRKTNPLIGSKSDGYYYVRTSKQLEPTIAMLTQKQAGMEQTLELITSAHVRLSGYEEKRKLARQTIAFSVPKTKLKIG
jgi:hypothetical protein